MKVFMDTSAFAKRYVAEPGSDAVMALCQEADDLVKRHLPAGTGGHFGAAWCGKRGSPRRTIAN